MSVALGVRPALRRLSRAPGHALLVVSTLALAIGATAAMFAVAHEALLRPLPLRDPDRLVALRDRSPEGAVHAMSPVAWAAVRARVDVFGSVCGSTDAMYTLTGKGEPESVLAYQFANGVFETLGVSPALGRTFTAEDDRPGAPPVVVLSHRLWQRRLGADPPGGPHRPRGRAAGGVSVSFGGGTGRQG